MARGASPVEGGGLPGFTPGAKACVPSGLGMFWMAFLGLKPQALCLRPFRGSRIRSLEEQGGADVSPASNLKTSAGRSFWREGLSGASSLCPSLRLRVLAIRTSRPPLRTGRRYTGTGRSYVRTSRWYGRGSRSYGQGSCSYGRGSDSYGRGSDSYSRGSRSSGWGGSVGNSVCGVYSP